ncbi:hypothetical protein RJ640_001915 [Escallonia rubra]|uniref:Glucosidase II beta subunit N-terminal domain-containing protein n=1 Tax=Escallonia rubra TaxID=112253 RepID=A0AA88U6Q2_9ASTE|nr:hypothetical protein RJ640_001915 [Escallonia rubra]
MAVVSSIGLISLVFFFSGILFTRSSSSSSVLPIGIHPLDEKYFASEVINCKDGSKSFTRDRLNDDFCDCADGTDEPGTSACPAGKFYCRNVGSTPQFLFSSRNSRLFLPSVFLNGTILSTHLIVDCCDGSDEYDDSVVCPNTCIMGGNVPYKMVNHATTRDLGSVDTLKNRNGIKFEDSVQKLKGLLEDSFRAIVEAKAYEQIPDLLSASKESCLNSNPFSFLSSFTQIYRTQLIDDILQSFIPVRPRSRLQVAYSCLLSYTLQSDSPLPLALAILQRTLRSGCVPVPQTRLLLSSSWLDGRRQSQSVCKILLEMQSIGYNPDCGTCNYLITSLCKVDQWKEAVQVLKSMAGAGCIPDLDSYVSVVDAMCELRRTTDVAELMREMVTKFGLNPRQEMVVKVAATLRLNKEIWRAVEMIEFLQREGIHVTFESYESVVEGCLECREFVLAGKVVTEMTRRGYIPYIRVRQKVVDGLAGAGEWELAYAVRQRLAELNS